TTIGDIKGTVAIVGDEGTPMDTGEVYLYDSTRTLIDSACIGAITDHEYKFVGYDPGTYYVKLKTVRNTSTVSYIHYEWCYESTYYGFVVNSSGQGGANIVADESGSDITSCND
ncbi:MAG: hypothetical protein ACP5G4_08435, partial [bacterium]